ncbi:MAG: gluconate 2-dehydrogenase subunit 3 family protein [Dehalococcoidales bacterium]|nr:gluconate 2-dehydrogenase subunit 3 family protein [Dehalococcoidales bacterium]
MPTYQETAVIERWGKAIKVVSRRDFLKAGAAAVALATLSACTGTRVPTTPTATLPFRPSTLTDYQVLMLEAATGRIIPTDDAPGATEAGVARFIDRALGEEEDARLADYISGIGELDIVSDSKFTKSFIELTPSEQDEVLKALETTPFFSLLRTHTIWGMFADPIYGGNQDMVGWKLIKFSGATFHPLQTGHIEPGWMPTDADYNSLLSRYGDINPYGQ